jgi:proline utilization trans-activator
MCLLRQLLAELHTDGDYSTVAEPVKALLKTSQDSAMKSLRILVSLQSQHLLGEQVQSSRPTIRIDVLV